VVDVSTVINNIACTGEIEYHQALHAFLCRLEAAPCLSRPEQLAERLIALNELDAIIGNLDMEAFTTCSDSRINARAKALRTRLEAANEEIYECARSKIVLQGHSCMLPEWLQGPASDRESGIPCRGLGFDLRDEIVSGVLQLREPGEPGLLRSPEMVPYQPTPARHILNLIASTGLSDGDILVDIGSGLGHVALLVSILTGNRTLGVEFQPAYIASAQECVRNLHLSRVRFVAEDARAADLSSGTVFYLFSPFTGSILTDVLSRLRKESADRPIRICSLGPCTRMLEHQAWLKASTRPDTERITVFKSQ
jgi:hypothetical protein